MTHIFKSRTQSNRFIILLIIIAALTWLLYMVKDFEKDWYDLEYDNYKKNAEEYNVTNAEIVNQKIFNGTNDKSLRIIDFYLTDIVEITFDGGQVMRFRTSREPGDKIGDAISVAYDARYDTEYDELMQEYEGDPSSEENYLTIPRTHSVKNHTVSTILAIIILIVAIITGIYVFRCYKKPDVFSY